MKEPNELTDAELSKVLDFGDIVNGHVRAVRSEAFKRANSRKGSIPGYKLAPGKETREWKDPDTVDKDLIQIGLDRKQIFTEVLASPAQIEKALKTIFKGNKVKLEAAMEKFNKLIRKQSSGNLALVRDIDPRQEVKRGHEFKDKVGKYVKSDGMEDLL